MYLKYRKIAIDYDGTIAPNVYPGVGEPYPEAVRVIRRIREAGGRIIIWTCRSGKQAKLVKEALAAAGVEYDTFNECLPEHIEEFGGDTRKVFADVYIDDKANFCETIDWKWVESKLFEEVV